MVNIKNAKVIDVRYIGVQVSIGVHLYRCMSAYVYTYMRVWVYKCLGVQVHVKINPKASVLNMNCHYMTVVDCLKVTPLKIQHDSCS